MSIEAPTVLQPGLQLQQSTGAVAGATADGLGPAKPKPSSGDAPISTEVAEGPGGQAPGTPSGEPGKRCPDGCGFLCQGRGIRGWLSRGPALLAEVQWM